MKFLAIIYNDESQCANATPEDIAASFAGHGALIEDGAKAGAVLGGEGLQPVATATTLRVRDDERHAHRRPVRRDQGAARRLLPVRVQGPRRGARLGGQDPRGQDRRGRGPAGHGLRRARRRRPPARRAPRPERGPQNVLVDRLFRRESGQAVAVLARILGDLDRAEEAVQDAFLTALERWPRDGAAGQPARPGSSPPRATGRSTGSAPRSAGRGGACALEAELRALGGGEDERARSELVSPIPDERLRLIFTTCHPALAPEARVGLTLRALGGLTTAEVARAFLDLRARDGAADHARQGARSPAPASATRSRATPTCRSGCAASSPPSI